MHTCGTQKAHRSILLLFDDFCCQVCLMCALRMCLMCAHIFMILPSLNTASELSNAVSQVILRQKLASVFNLNFWALNSALTSLNFKDDRIHEISNFFQELTYKFIHEKHPKVVIWVSHRFLHVLFSPEKGEKSINYFRRVDVFVICCVATLY